ncbi:hypothetical protein FIBSPDRAFT_929685 [Athelia psychrophila]|uniref:Extracellular membrane protein CFEM domain-containing protein n=1 Tax=Athelia psychrophila TaxID=1759441 RepID=A0A166NAL5_9AGAM|nr:hypothetical protein FIBSPDRAFT_929685 [Fibularhizoctonia sp. CBS 109695]
MQFSKSTLFVAIAFAATLVAAVPSPASADCPASEYGQTCTYNSDCACLNKCIASDCVAVEQLAYLFSWTQDGGGSHQHNMSLNERDPTIAGGNPVAANFVDNPTSDDLGAGAGPNFHGGAHHKHPLKDTAGVIGNTDIIESAHIAPLIENSSNDDCFANMATDTRSKADVNLEQARGVGQRAYETVSGAAQMAYGHVVGDESAKQAGHEAYGERQ